jgi:hypothetical protein
VKRTIATAGAILAGLMASATALASDDEIRHDGTCSGSSSSEIKVKPDDGRIEVEFEVDQNKYPRAQRLVLARAQDRRPDGQGRDRRQGQEQGQRRALLGDGDAVTGSGDRARPGAT